MDDIDKGEKRSGIHWDLAAAQWVIGYFRDVLCLAGGQHEGRPFSLAPSQQFLIGSLFGWKAADGFRRFRVGYIEIAKGNGKSPLAAGIGLYMMTADNEPRAEIYAAAVDKDQAKILFRDAVAMVDQSPLLEEQITRSGGRGREWNLAHLESGSFFRPISSENTGRGKSGPRPHCALLDEIHEHPTAAMVEFMRAGTKGRRQALILMITNSGIYDPTSVCWNYHDYAARVVNRQTEDDSFFCFVAGLDKEDSWQDRAVWKKANPLLGISIPEKYLEEQVREATGMPSKQSVVRRLNFCEWVEAANPFVDPEIWRANGGAVDLEFLKGRECCGALDLSTKNDLSSLVLDFELDEDVHAILARFWTPQDLLRQHEEQDRAPYGQWVREGHLTAVPGKAIDYTYIAKALGELTKIYRIQAVAFDPWRIDDMIRALEAEGVDIDLVPHGQGFKDMSPSIEALEDTLLKNHMQHGNHPVLTWCISNAQVEKDPAANRKFTKRKSTGRIDGAVALAMAEGLAASRKGQSDAYTGIRYV